MHGCGGTRTGAEVEVPHVDAPPASGLVWIRDAQGRDRTLWVSAEDGTPLSSQPIEGPLWAERHTLWQWLEEPVVVPLYDDEPVGSLLEPSARTAEVVRGVLRELTEDVRAIVIEAPDLGPAREIRHSVSLEGSAGPFLFFTERTYLDAWGAHGAEERRAVTWDLRAGAPTELATERERATWLQRARARALDEGLLEESSDEVRLVALHPRWERDRGLQIEVQAAAIACYACSDGEWSDYTRSVRIELETPPERLDGGLPRWVRNALADREEATLMGFTRVEHPAPARILESLRR